jgi:hypothetical protein
MVVGATLKPEATMRHYWWQRDGVQRMQVVGGKATDRWAHRLFEFSDLNKLDSTPEFKIRKLYLPDLGKLWEIQN